MNTKNLGLQTDNHINWKNHIQEMIHTFSGECYSITWMGHISNINTLKSIYYAYFHSIKIYGNNFGGMTLPTVGSLFKQSEILPVPCQYTLSLMNFIINNLEIFLNTFIYT